MAVVITGSVAPLRQSLADALEARGHRVTAVEAVEDLEPGLAGGSAEERAGTWLRIGFHAVHAEPHALAATTSAQWSDRVDEPLRAALAFHQAASRHVPDGGRIVVVLPTTGLTGAAGAVGLAAVAEAERSLAKSQARALGARGVTVNCLAVSSELLAGAAIDRPGLQPASLPAPSMVDVADVVGALIDARLGAVTGQTIAVDAGRWTAP